MGIGDVVRPDGPRNVCSYLESEKMNPVCGTSLPDLGPKLYIARPRVQLDDKGRKEFQVYLTPNVLAGRQNNPREGPLNYLQYVLLIFMISLFPPDAQDPHGRSLGVYLTRGMWGHGSRRHPNF